MFDLGKSKTIFFPSNTLIYGISRDGSKNFNLCTCEHMILGQLTMGARQAKNAPLIIQYKNCDVVVLSLDHIADSPSRVKTLWENTLAFVSIR